MNKQHPEKASKGRQRLKKNVLPVSSITDEFDCVKVTLKRFPSSRCQRLWDLVLKKRGRNMFKASSGQVKNATQ